MGTPSGGNVGGYRNKRHPKLTTIVELQEMLDSLPQGPIKKAVRKKVYKVTEGLF